MGRPPSTHKDRLTNRGGVSVVHAGDWLFFSAPFWNVGTGVALVLGTWLRPQTSEFRVSGGYSPGGAVPPGEIARGRLAFVIEEDGVREALAGEAALICGIEYSDLDGEQVGRSEVEVHREAEGNWIAGRTNLFRPGEEEPYASGGW